MKPEQQRAILNIALQAASADVIKDKRESEKISRIGKTFAEPISIEAGPSSRTAWPGRVTQAGNAGRGCRRIERSRTS